MHQNAYFLKNLQAFSNFYRNFNSIKLLQGEHAQMPAVYVFKMHVPTIDTNKYAKNAYFTEFFQKNPDFFENSLQGYAYIYIFLILISYTYIYY